MIIAQQQLEALGAPHKEAFIAKTLVFLRKECAQWAMNKEDEVIVESIENMIYFAKRYDVKKEVNVQKLLYHWIQSELELPFKQPLKDALMQENVSEDKRVKDMIKKTKGSWG
ncbi:MAG: hypothetical protein KA408_05570 [Flavobacteriales bacterium]|nr:hypothetical protein [Flavobacteriales bacterium]